MVFILKIYSCDRMISISQEFLFLSALSIGVLLAYKEPLASKLIDALITAARILMPLLSPVLNSSRHLTFFLLRTRVRSRYI